MMWDERECLKFGVELDARVVALQDDFEKRIVGWWEYPGSTFEIRLEPWGALVFQEDTVKIELMKKGKLRWRGEVELISGMVLNLSFEPGSDVLVLEFIPPSDAQLKLKFCCGGFAVFFHVLPIL